MIGSSLDTWNWPKSIAKWTLDEIKSDPHMISVNDVCRYAQTDWYVLPRWLRRFYEDGLLLFTQSQVVLTKQIPTSNTAYQGDYLRYDERHERAFQVMIIRKEDIECCTESDHQV